MTLAAPQDRDDWVGTATADLPVAAVSTWVGRPGCGAVVTFVGTVRDHAEGRPDVRALHYEAFEEEVAPRMAAIAREARRRWPGLGRMALLHRLGTLGVGEASVLVAVSAPHRAEAFDAARFAIDTVKTSVPIWKRETWAGGEDWSAGAHPVGEVPSAAGEAR